jgi:2-isopropylmalate synthase
VDPRLDITDIDALKHVAEYCNRLPVHPRHPYAGDLVYTAFSGSHQDAIKKGMNALPAGYDRWEVPYLPIDPKHTGRSYEAIIRVNSQSGKGGVAYLMDAEYGLDLPRQLQVEFSRQVQAVTESSGTEIKPGELWDVFTEQYLPDDAGIRLISSEVSSTKGAGGESATRVVAQVLVDGRHETLSGTGNGPVAALIDGLRPTWRSRIPVAAPHGASAWTRAPSTPASAPSSAPPTGFAVDRPRRRLDPYVTAADRPTGAAPRPRAGRVPRAGRPALAGRLGLR